MLCLWCLSTVVAPIFRFCSKNVCLPTFGRQNLNKGIHFMNTTITHYFKFSHYFQYVGIISGCLLIFLIFALLFPLDLQSTYADELATQSDTSSISLALDQELTLNITPTAAGATSTTSSNFTVSTSSNAGYKIYLDTLDPTANLTNVDSTKSNSYVSALPTPTSLANLPANTWGFALTSDPVNSHTTFSGPTDSTTPIISTEESAARDVYHFTLAANLDTSLPAGQYANTLLVSAIANPETITGLRSLIYMQDMTSDICTQSAIHDEKQLIDSRDNQSYWVAKLKDGNCWMVQNLAYDIKTSVPLSAANSDIMSDWYPPTNTSYAIPAASSSYSPTDTYSWNLGRYVLATPSSATSCDATTGVLTTGKTLSNCSNFQEVSNWQPTFSAQPGTWKGTEYDLVAADEATETYDAHYLIGNYYQWNIATASSDGTSVSTGAETDPSKLVDAPYSLCPKNWQLPASGRNINTDVPFDRENSFYRLVLSYNYPNVANSIINQRLYFVPAGLINVHTGALRLAGQYGVYWGSTAGTTARQAYGLRMGYPDDLLPSGPVMNRFDGLSIRCLAR